MVKAEVVQVESIETDAALDRIVERLAAGMGGDPPQVLLVVAGIDFDHQRIVERLASAFPGALLVGCTTAGELSSDLGFSEDSIAVMGMASDVLSFGAGVGGGLSADPVDATRRALDRAREAMTSEERICLAFPNGLHDAPEAVIDTLNRHTAEGCVVFGALSSRFWRSQTRTRQFFGDRVYEDALCLLLIGGPVRQLFIVCNSWEPVGTREQVLLTDGREVLQIGDLGALEFYRHYLGPHSSPALEFPLAVFESENGGFYIRSPMDYNAATGGVSFPTPIPVGAAVQLTEATRKRLIQDLDLQLEGLAAHARRLAPPDAAIVFSCATRKQILGTWTAREIDLLRRHLPPSLPILGFYSYGEISPIPGLDKSWLHNCTMVTLLLGEAGSPGRPPGGRERRDVERGRTGEAFEDPVRRVRFLQKRLERSEAYRERLEINKDLTTELLRKINRDINAARLEIKRKNEMVARTLALADEIQRNLLPGSGVRSAWFDIAGTSLFCSETGGDYYDILMPEGEGDASLRVAVGDVTGHGVEAALLMTTARALLRGRLSRAGDFARVIGDVNQQLARDVRDSGRFVTLFLLSLDGAAGTLEWVRAGHEPAVWFDPVEDRVVALRGPGIALGVDPEAVFETRRQEGLREGHILLLGTDGLWETRNEAGEPFGRSRILEAVRERKGEGAEAILEGVMNRLEAFRGRRPPEDDITLVVVKVLSPSAALLGGGI